MQRKWLVSAFLVILAFPAWGSTVVTLFAGKTTNVGNVTVATVGSNLTVTYNLTSPFVMSESSLDVACSLGAIPVTRQGNPVPGHFPFQSTNNPPVTTYTYTIPLSNSHIAACSAPTDTIYVAAHAVVEGGTTSVVSSPASTNVTLARSGDDATPFLSETPINNPAVAAWMPCSTYPNCANDTNTTPTINQSFSTVPQDSWDSQLTPSGTAAALNSAGAVWIWESKFTNGVDPNAVVNGRVLRFLTPFSLTTVPSTAMLTVSCDNGYQAYVNGTSVGTSTTVSGACPGASCWKDSNLYQSFVQTTGWQTAQTFDVHTLLVTGANNITVDGGNEHFDVNDSPNPEQGNVQNNPGGCIYALTLGGTGGQETAWGNGPTFPHERQWGTYFTYTVGN